MAFQHWKRDAKKDKEEFKQWKSEWHASIIDETSVRHYNVEGSHETVLTEVQKKRSEKWGYSKLLNYWNDRICELEKCDYESKMDDGAVVLEIRRMRAAW